MNTPPHCAGTEITFLEMQTGIIYYIQKLCDNRVIISSEVLLLIKSEATWRITKVYILFTQVISVIH